MLFPSIDARKETSPENHRYLSGNWLISAIRHDLSYGKVRPEGNFMTRMTLKKDAFEIPLPSTTIFGR